MAVNLIYITTENKTEAERIGRTLVEEHLAACVNIIDGMTSIYRWEGKLMQDTETILIAKTVQEKVAALTSDLLSRKTPAALKLIQNEAESGRELSQLLGELIGCLRGLLIAKLDPSADGEGIPEV